MGEREIGVWGRDREAGVLLRANPVEIARAFSALHVGTEG